MQRAEFNVLSMKDSTMLTLVTGNVHKAEEIQTILGLPVKAVKLDLPELQAMEVRDVVVAKAKAAFAIIQSPVLVDDTGLHVDALGGLPGALAAWFLKAVGAEGILRMVGSGGDRRARFVTCIGYCTGPEQVEVFVGDVQGTLAERVQGQNGFGFDPIFVPEGESRTIGAMTTEEKHAVSARGRALEKLKAHLAAKGIE